MKKLPAKLLLAILILVVPPLSLAQEEPYFMWTDENGVLNFSQREPKDVTAEEIEKEHHFGWPMPKREEVQPEAAPEPLDRSTQIPDEVSDLEQINARTNEKSCASARRTLEKLQSFETIIVLGDDGFWREISEEARQLEVRSAQEAIAEYCQSGS